MASAHKTCGFLRLGPSASYAVAAGSCQGSSGFSSHAGHAAHRRWFSAPISSMLRSDTSSMKSSSTSIDADPLALGAAGSARDISATCPGTTFDVQRRPRAMRLNPVAEESDQGCAVSVCHNAATPCSARGQALAPAVSRRHKTRRADEIRSCAFVPMRPAPSCTPQ